MTFPMCIHKHNDLNFFTIKQTTSKYFQATAKRQVLMLILFFKDIQLKRIQGIRFLNITRTFLSENLSIKIHIKYLLTYQNAGFKI
jgi:hypothetical protein